MEKIKVTTLKQLNELVHEHVFGQSVHAVTEEELITATASACWNDPEYGTDRIECGCSFRFNGNIHIFPEFTRKGKFRAEPIWETRHGQPYQSDLEAHVAAYRKPCPDYSGDWREAGKVIEWLGETSPHRLGWWRHKNTGAWTCESGLTAFVPYEGKTPQIAICMAALAYKGVNVTLETEA